MNWEAAVGRSKAPSCSSAQDPWHPGPWRLTVAASSRTLDHFRHRERCQIVQSVLGARSLSWRESGALYSLRFLAIVVQGDTHTYI